MPALPHIYPIERFYRPPEQKKKRIRGPNKDPYCLELDHEALRSVIDASPDPILITNEKARIIYVNAAWEKQTGYSFEEVVGKNPRLTQSDKTPANVYRTMWRDLTSHKPFNTDEFINKKKNGIEYQIHTTIYPILHSGSTRYFVQIEHDITALKHLEQLRQDFLSSAAHELKTPITVLKLLIQTHIRTIQENRRPASKAELSLIEHELDRLTRLIDDILDSSRIETGKQSFFFQQANIVDLVRKTVQGMQVYARNHRIILVTLAEHIYTVVDPDRIEQVLLNLLSNAVKYSPEKTTITVTVQPKGKRVLISVQDQGIGIAPGKQQLIFDRYYQVKTKSKIGFGLGLYISKEIIKRHKGRIWVESKKNEGSTFYVSLPLTQQPDR